MARPMVSTSNPVGNPDLANSPNFSSAGGDPASVPPVTKDDLDAIDAALDSSGVVDKPKQEVEADILRLGTSRPRMVKQEAEKKETPAPKEEPAQPKTEPKPVPDESKAKTEPPKVEAKPTTPDPKATVTTPEPAKVDQPKDEEIDSIQEPKGLNPTNSENWKKLRETARKYKTEVSNVSKKYGEAVAYINKLQQEKGKLPEEVEKELTDHRSFRRTFDYQRHPEFIEKFEKPIKDTEDQIYGLLKENGMTDKDMDLVKKVGIDRIARASWDETIKKMTDSQVQSEREAGILLRKLIGVHAEKLVDKKQEISKMESGQSEFVKKQEEAKKKELEDEVGYVKTHLEKLEKEYEILRPLQAPADATPEQKKAVEEHNNFIEETKRRFVLAYKPASTEQRFQTAMAACYAFIADRELQKLDAQLAEVTKTKDAQIKSLTDELEKIKNATKMPSGDKNDTGGSKKSGSAETKYTGMKTEDAVDAAMREAGL